ncbi:MAG TPA: lanthionine synthetase LanC family protein [Longimicrobium sp.]|nr:lanthionine synthetase LanC family protein [Longimicrobium sp.]
MTELDLTAQADPGTFLDAAQRIGRRVAADAQWEGDACTWQIMSPDRENPRVRRAVAATAGGAIYEGTSGIALFLAELSAVTGDPEAARTALGALRFALREGATQHDSAFGFHSGRVGIAYAAARVGELLGREDLFAEAEELLRPLAGNESRDFGMDVIGGAGGAIPALLRLARHVDAELATGIATRLGDHLINVAARDADGFSWSTMRSSSIRNLCGYAHGAAGMGHGLLELYAATGEGRYRYAAEQAFLYERRFFSPEASNWPDLRHTELGEYQFEGRLDELRDRLRAGNPLEPQGMRYMSAWCHGGPGIGFPRLRAYQLLGDPLYLQEARASFQSVVSSLTDAMEMNFSLCHGRGGNAETLLEGARMLGEDELLQPARAVALWGIRRFEDQGVPWPCGTMGAVQDPGLLLGESGIGLFLLRLARPEVPSAIFLTAPDDAAAQGGHAGAEGFAALARRTVEEHFDRTLRIFAALGEDVEAIVPRPEMGPAPRESDVEKAHDAIAAHVAGVEDGDRRARLEDAFLVDRVRYELARSVADYTEEVMDGLARLPRNEVDWQQGRAGLSPRSRLASTRWDWDAWLEAGDPSAPPEEEDTWFLAQFTAGRVNVRPLRPFPALVLQLVQEPAPLEEVVAGVEEAVATPEGAPDRDWLQAQVVQQLGEAYQAGFVDFERGMVGAGA